MTLVLCGATHARADEAKTYRWVGQDGRVYTTPTPPPKGAGTVIEVKPAKPKKAAPAPASAADSNAGLSPLRRFLKEAASAEQESQQRAAEARAAAEAAEGVAPEGASSPCARHTYWINRWRSADRSVQDAEEYLDNLQSDTRGFMTKYETNRLDRMDSAERRVEAAEDYLSQVEADATAAGVPSNCLTH